jgi:hypothetical protein
LVEVLSDDNGSLGALLNVLEKADQSGVAQPDAQKIIDFADN